MTMERWREEIAQMDYDLSLAAGRVKATAEDSDLRMMRQVEADRINWRLAAFQLAGPVLDALYREHRAARDSESYHRSASRDDTAWWGKLAATLGTSGLVLLFVSSAFDVSGWVILVGVLMLTLAVAAGLCAVFAHRDGRTLP